jgi:hypothetical protein
VTPAYHLRSTLTCVPYEWDDWALQALAGIEPYEVLQIISARHRWPRRGATPDGLAALTIWGRTQAGRPLIVAVHHQSGFTWKIIGAREMTTGELAEFLRWEETR